MANRHDGYGAPPQGWDAQPASHAQQQAWPQQQPWPQQPQQHAQQPWPQQPQHPQQQWPQQAPQPQHAQQQSPQHPPAAPPAATAQEQYGDGAGEHLRTRRGKYSAWPHVVVAFLYQAGFVGTIVGALAAVLASLAIDDPGIVGIVFAVVGALAGIPAAFFTFRDRWRTIEAFSSRYCAGMLNFSLLYVPTVAWVYANVRAIRKLQGR